MERKQGVADIQPPDSTAKVRSFVGMANYFRSFIKEFSTLIKPLTALCSTRVRFHWDSVHSTSFQAIKSAILDAPILYHVDYTLELYLRTDASIIGIGGMLYQKHNDIEHPICFLSRAFTPTEQKWSTIEQEGYASFYCITQCEPYLLGHHFYLETDHANLMKLYMLTAPKIVRWRLRLAEFSFTVIHIPGKSNVVADALSRCFV